MSPDFHATKSSNSHSTFDEHRWVIQIRQTLNELELEDDIDIPVSIFNVPKSLMTGKPDCYIPQQIAFGPYHHWRPELYEMERYKLSAAKRTQKRLQGYHIKFQCVVDQLAMLEARVRASYHKYLDFNGETLAWIMAVDISFLLEFLEVFAIKKGRALRESATPRMSHLVDVAGRKSAHNVILRDMVMLENQIPLLLMRKMLEFQCSSRELADETLCSMLIGLCKELSPIKMMEELPDAGQVADRSHPLDFLYHMIVPNLEEQSEITDAEDQDEVTENEQKPSSKSIYLKKLITNLVSFLKRVVRSEPIKLIIRYPWMVISNLPPFRILKQHVQYFQDKQEVKDENENNDSTNKPPLFEEISIPSITNLSKAGVRFLPTTGGILTINFDLETSIFYLPTVSLDVNSEVILRNLVAYETCNASGPLIFTRYTELMNGIIDTEEDAKYLRERGIIVNRMKSDEEVANLWNGMSRSVRLTKVPFLDKVIEDVNVYYKGKWRVIIGRLMKKYVFSSWQLLTLLAALLILMSMTLQMFSSVLRCTSLLLVRNIR